MGWADPGPRAALTVAVIGALAGGEGAGPPSDGGAGADARSGE